MKKINNIFIRNNQHSFSKKILLVIIVMLIITTAIIDTVSIYQNRANFISQKSDEAISVAKMVVPQINPEKFKELSDAKAENDYYTELRSMLDAAKTASSVKYMYAIVPNMKEKSVFHVAEGAKPSDNPDDIYSYGDVVGYDSFFDDEEEINDFETAYKSGKTYDNGFYNDPDFGYLYTVFAPIIDAEGNVVGMIGVDLDANSISEEANKLLIMLVAISIIGMIAMSLIAKQFIKRNVSDPLKEIVNASERIAIGDVDVDLLINSNDEIGTLANSFLKMADNIKQQSQIAESIAAGNLDINIVPKSEKDLLSKSLKLVISNLKNLIQEAKMMTDAALMGELRKRADEKAFQGAYQEIIIGMNNTLEAVVEPLDITAEYLNMISIGEIPPTISAEYKGEYLAMINSLNVCIEAINGLVNDATTLSNAAASGNLSTRADVGKHSGHFAKVISLLNNTLDVISMPLKMASDNLQKIGNGEIPQRIEAEYNGDYNIIKNSVNACVDGLGALVEGNEMLNRMSVNDYSKTLDGTYVGIYEEMRERINNVISSVRDTIYVISDVSEGNMSRLEALKSIGKKGDSDTLIPSMITMLESIKLLVAETVIISSEATKGNIRARGDESKFKGDFKEVVKGINRTLDAIEAPVGEALSLLEEMSEGNLDKKMIGDYEGSYEIIKNTMNRTNDQLKSYVSEISAVLSGISEGDLRQAITVDYKGDFIIIKNSLNHIIESLSEVLGNIGEAAEQVNSGAIQVSDGAQTLSQGSTEQASAIQQLSASIAEIAAQTKQNATSANKANDLASEAKEYAEKGNGQMNEMLSSMAEINQASASISKVIKVIDDIAFQTNILALNAAVEAARAGQHGKGFAVVAEEVRNLAARSAAAAKETNGLIAGSIEKIDLGTKTANETARALFEIVNKVGDAAELVQNIAEASNIQATGIAQINKGIEQVAQVISNNSATAEQSAAASEELSYQSELLKQMVGTFKLSGKKNTNILSLPIIEKSYNREAARIILDEEYDKY